LLRRRPWGYLLASVTTIKLLTVGAAVSAMGVSMLWAGVDANPAELIVFPTLTLACVVLTIRLLMNVDPHVPASR